MARTLLAATAAQLHSSGLRPAACYYYFTFPARAEAAELGTLGDDDCDNSDERFCISCPPSDLISTMTPKEHWESIYQSKAPDQVSWFQPRPTVSLDLIRRIAPRTDAAIIDVGGGASTLVDALLSLGYTRVTVSDIAGAGLQHAQSRLGAAAGSVAWRCADVLEDELPAASLDVWHDRAVFHFLTAPADRARYVAQVARAVRPNGHVIIGTFADDGPRRCSGLDVVRYSAAGLHSEFGPRFELIDKIREEHLTPGGSRQAFQYCLCSYRPVAIAAA